MDQHRILSTAQYLGEKSNFKYQLAKDLQNNMS
jgi:hypothetical protein